MSLLLSFIGDLVLKNYKLLYLFLLNPIFISCAYRDDAMIEYQKSRGETVVVESSHVYKNNSYQQDGLMKSDNSMIKADNSLMKVDNSSQNNSKNVGDYNNRNQVLQTSYSNNQNNQNGNNQFQNNQNYPSNFNQNNVAVSNVSQNQNNFTSVLSTGAQGELDANGYYTVQPKDSLYRISLKFNTKMSILIEDNNLPDDGSIKIGQKIKIPQQQSIDVYSSSNQPQVATSQIPVKTNYQEVQQPSQQVQNQNTNFNQSVALQPTQLQPVQQVQNSGGNNTSQIYKVKAGDTFYSISRKYGLTVQQLLDANSMNNQSVLKLGSTLLVPVSALGVVPDSKVAGGQTQQKNTSNTSSVPVIPVASSSAEVVSSGIASSVPVVSVAPSSSASVLKQSEKSETSSRRLAADSIVEKNDFENSQVKNNIDIASTKNETYSYPIEAKIISTFGKKNKGIYNDGILFEVKRDSDIVASKSGTIFYASFLKNYNNVVIIKHEDGYLTVYGNLDKMSVQKGDTILKGQKIASVSPKISKTFYFSVRTSKAGQKSIDPISVLQK